MNKSKQLILSPIDGGISAPLGFEAASCAAGIKYADRADMALIYSKTPCRAAGTFTKNVVKAAPVLWDKKIIDDENPVQAIVVNAGIANACTGDEGWDACAQTAKSASQQLSISPENVLIGSTGVIGMQLPMDAIKRGIDIMTHELSHSREAAHKAACAIMTTDTVPKEAACEGIIQGKRVRVGGMAKGSGMIHPDMCTMLAYITTDVSISTPLLKKAVQKAADISFNMISVDGDTSTNDTFIALANGNAENVCIDEENDDYELFCSLLEKVCLDLAKMMARDGEGATKLIMCTVSNASSLHQARVLARSVISSNLTKAAMFGRDANWGRILCALGYAGVNFDPSRTSVSFASDASKEDLLVFSQGSPCEFSEERAAELLSCDTIHIKVDLHEGEFEACAFGCDLTHEYVSINADYRS